MTSHLSPGEFVDLADGTLAAERAAHVETCERCRASREEFAALLAGVEQADPAPEPSPLFWERFDGRVRAATGPIGIAPESRWAWRAAWRPVAATIAVAATVVLAVLLRTSAPSLPIEHDAIATDDPALAATSPADDEAQWNQMVAAASTMSRDDVYQVASSAPSLGEAVLLDDLTPTERATFVELLQSELGGSE